MRRHGPASFARADSHATEQGSCGWDTARRALESAGRGGETSGEIARRYCIWYYFLVTRAKHHRILESMFKKPTPAGIRWTDIVAMLQAAGVEVSQRSGSRALLKKGADRMVIHRPHPETETGRATVRDIAAFLESIGVNP